MAANTKEDIDLMCEAEKKLSSLFNSPMQRVFKGEIS
jgi:hypothetical protein